MAHRRSTSSGNAGGIAILGILIFLAAIVALIYIFRDTAPQAPPTNKQSQTREDQEETKREEARRIALSGLQQFYTQQGLDVQVSEGANHELILSSDLFKDVVDRDHAIQLFMRNHAAIKTICSLGFWELQVGYSKGFLAGDVARTVSLGCPEERKAIQEEQQALQDRRNQFAATVQSGFQQKGMQNIKAAARGTVLVFTSDSLFDTDSARRDFLAMFGQNADTVQRLCSIGFKRVDIRTTAGNHLNSPLPCPQ